MRPVAVTDSGKTKADGPKSVLDNARIRWRCPKPARSRCTFEEPADDEPGERDLYLKDTYVRAGEPEALQVPAAPGSARARRPQRRPALLPERDRVLVQHAQGHGSGRHLPEPTLLGRGRANEAPGLDGGHHHDRQAPRAHKRHLRENSADCGAARPAACSQTGPAHHRRRRLRGTEAGLV